MTFHMSEVAVVLVGAFGWLFYNIGKPVAVAVAFCFANLYLNFYLTQKMDLLGKEERELKTSRTNETNQTIENIKLLKLYGWQDLFE